MSGKSVVTCPYCRQSFDRITKGWRRTPAPQVENPLASAMVRDLEQKLDQAHAALKRTKDNEHTLLAQLAAAERQGFHATPAATQEPTAKPGGTP